jgi:hypothetical protein
MGWIVDILKIVLKNIKSLLLISDNIDKLVRSTSACESNISSMKDSIQSLAGNYRNLNKYGSEGAISAIKELDKKVGFLVTDVAVLKKVVLNGSSEERAEARELRADERESRAEERESREIERIKDA